MTGHTYAIADLHGRFDLLQAALEAIAAHATEPGTVVFTGDYVDRGPQSRQIIERLMLGLSDGWRLICLKGNHEDMMVRCLRGLAPLSWWCGNGGYQTLMSYGNSIGEIIDPLVVPEDHISWLDGLPLMHVDDRRVFVHAGVDPTRPLAQQDGQEVMWKLYAANDDRGHGDRHVVHGHHQFADGPILLAGRSDLDTFAWYTGRIVVGVFDDAVPGGPVDLIEVIGAPDKRAEK